MRQSRLRQVFYHWHSSLNSEYVRDLYQHAAEKFEGFTANVVYALPTTQNLIIQSDFSV